MSNILLMMQEKQHSYYNFFSYKNYSLTKRICKSKAVPIWQMVETEQKFDFNSSNKCYENIKIVNVTTLKR